MEEGGVKVNLFRKNPIGLKVIGSGNFMFSKNILKKIYKYSSYLPSKCFSFKVLHLLPGLQVKPKFQIVTSFFDTNHGRGSSEGTFATNISLVLPVWTRIHMHYKNVKNLTVSKTAQKISVRGFFSECKRIHRKLCIWSYLCNVNIASVLDFQITYYMQYQLHKSEGGCIKRLLVFQRHCLPNHFIFSFLPC